MTIINSLWVEKYRPKTINDYVFANSHLKNQLQKWIDEKDCPNLLFTGPPGTGKTSICKMLVNELEIDPYDVLFINASRENNIDTMRDKISNFTATTPWGKQRIIILDEADFLGSGAQSILRGLMEQYYSSRFLLTANWPARILPPIHSRVQRINIDKLPIEDFTVKMAEILVTEKIEFDLETLDDYVRGCWPDLRKTIHVCQQNSINGKLIKQVDSIDNSQDYKINVIELFKEHKFREARTLVCKQIKAEELEDFFTFLYNNLDLLGNTEQEKDQAILIIRKGMCQIPIASDPEILIAATLTEIIQIKDEK